MVDHHGRRYNEFTLTPPPPTDRVLPSFLPRSILFILINIAARVGGLSHSVVMDGTLCI